MADVLYQSIREGINQKLVEQADGTYASTYLAAPQVALETDVLYQVIREGVNKKLVLQPDGTYSEVVEIIGGTGAVQWVPFIRFLVTQSGSNQTFMNTNLGFYVQDVDVDLFRISNGITSKLDPVMDFSLSGNSITVQINLLANDRLLIESKMLRAVQPVEVSYRLLQNGQDFRITQNGDRRITNQYIP